MGWDFSEETLRILEHGFEGPPPFLERGQTAPFAVWKRDRFGAVLFIRRWQNDNFDSDTTLTYFQDGRWHEPSTCAGGGIYDPFDRPSAGWNGSPVQWGRCLWQPMPDGEGEIQVAVTDGIASPSVAEIRILDPDEVPVDSVKIRPDTGVFVVGIFGNGRHTMVAIDKDRQVLRDKRGNAVFEEVDV